MNRYLVIAFLLFSFVACEKKPASTSKPTATPQAIVPPDDEVHATYAGSASCKECHEKAFADWQHSNHGMAERDVRPAQEEKPFATRQSLEHNGKNSAVYLDEKQLLQVLTEGRDKQVRNYTVTRIIGHNPLRQFLVPAPGNRLQTCDVTYDPHKNELFDIFGTDKREPGDWGHWTGQGMNWNAMCAACHNTRLRKYYDPSTDTYHTRMAEMGVSCESCHGPMKDHVDWRKKNPSTTAPDPTIRKFSRDQMLETCGPCHARRGEITGDMVPGESFFDHYTLTVTDLTDLYFPDGQVRDENYEFTSYLSSKMHHAGVRCVDCHDPHSGKRKLPGNALCMQCHAGGGTTNPPAPIINPTAHSRHAEGSAGNDCTSCHMPITTYMQRHPRHDHSFSIPNPRLTIDHGMPNACNKCHTDQDAKWAYDHAREWYGDKLEHPTHKRADIVARARRRDANVSKDLITMLASETIPTWQATACHLMEPWVNDAAVRESLISALKNPHPMVREAALRALIPMIRENHQRSIDTTRPLLNDASRSVRVAAAWAHVAKLDLSSPAGKELVHMLDLNSDQPLGRMQLSQFAYLRGDNAAAIKQMQQAINLDPNSPAMRHDLAILLSSTGDTAGALAALKEAIKQEPNNPEFHYKLALALSESGDAPAAIASLEKTVALDAAYGRAWYNLGLAYNAAGDTRKAIDALLRGENVEPSDPSIPYARATIHYRLGDAQQARAALMRTLQIRPDHQEALQLLQVLGQ